MTLDPTRVQPEPPPTRRAAAVLVLVYPRGNEPHVVFTERSPTLPTHPGQICLPGGSRDHTDPSLEYTALRETEEELGVPASQVRILGALGDVDTMGSYFRISPFVGILAEEPTFRPQPSEVAQVIEVPLSHLLDPRSLGEAEWQVRGGLRKSLFYGYQEHRIWGATAFVIAEFLETRYPAAAADALASILIPHPDSSRQSGRLS